MDVSNSDASFFPPWRRVGRMIRTPPRRRGRRMRMEVKVGSKPLLLPSQMVGGEGGGQGEGEGQHTTGGRKGLANSLPCPWPGPAKLGPSSAGLPFCTSASGGSGGHQQHSSSSSSIGSQAWLAWLQRPARAGQPPSKAKTECGTSAMSLHCRPMGAGLWLGSQACWALLGQWGW